MTQSEGIMWELINVQHEYFVLKRLPAMQKADFRGMYETSYLFMQTVLDFFVLVR